MLNFEAAAITLLAQLDAGNWQLTVSVLDV